VCKILYIVTKDSKRKEGKKRNLEVALRQRADSKSHEA
jgi:hypothetical protein